MKAPQVRRRRRAPPRRLSLKYATPPSTPAAQLPELLPVRSASARRLFCFDCAEPVEPGDPLHAAHALGTVGAAADLDGGRGLLSIPLQHVTGQEVPRLSTGIPGLDRVLGGGFAADSIVLLEGDPGIGKSTVLAMVAGNLSAHHRQVLYASGEEAAGQVGGRARRLKVNPDGVRLLTTGSLEELLREVQLLDAADAGPDVVIVDSAQALRSERVLGRAGSVQQVSFLADQLRLLAKQTRRIVVLVGQVTKDGDMAGPKTMEHAVDARLKFGRDAQDRRFILGIKNRYGATGELVTFEMGPRGLSEVADPMRLALEDSLGEPGVVPFVAGHLAQPVVITVEASVMPPTEESGARAVSSMGFPAERLRLLLDLIGRHCDLALSRDTVRVKVPKVADEPVDDAGLDLAVAAAIISAKCAIPVRAVVIGEVGLSGKVLPVPRLDARLDAARACFARFDRAVVPRRTTEVRGIERVMVEHLKDLKDALLAGCASARPTAPSNNRETPADAMIDASKANAP